LNKTQPSYPIMEFLKDIWHFMRIRKWFLLFLTFLLAISALLSLVPALIVAQIINFFITGTGSFDMFYMYIGALLVVGVADNVLRLGAKHYLMLYTNEMQKQAKVEAMQKVLQGDMLWHEEESTGGKIEKVLEGSGSVSRFMNFYINKGVDMVVKAIGIIAVFAFFSWKYALIVAVFALIYFVLEFKLNKKLSEKTLKLKIAKERASGKAYEISSNIGTVKSLGIETASNKQMVMYEEKLYDARKGRREASTIKWLIIQTATAIFYALLIFLVGKDILGGILSVGAIVIYVDYITRLNKIFNMISRESSEFIDMKHGMQRMMEIFNLVPDIDETEAKPLSYWKEIELRDVGFRYKREGVLEGLNMKIKRGQKIGIVGRSGSGKSTLFKLLLKLYLPKQGMIYFDGKPIDEITRESILKSFAIVPQETELFNLKLKDNVIISALGRVDYKKYEKALTRSHLNKFVAGLKEGDLTLVGERGMKLSGGQRQRLGIARALYKNSDVIIFDEATSNLDYETEKKIQQAIDALDDKTLIVSAHRLQTLKNMDIIYVMDHGRVVEKGSYGDLLKKKGVFYKMWMGQGSWKAQR